MSRRETAAGGEPLAPGDFLAQREFLRRLARGLLSGREGADDLVQETWLAASRADPRPWPSRGSLRAWLAGVLRNVARTSARGERRRREHEHRLEPPGTAAPAHSVAAALDVQRRVVEALQALAEPYRTVVVLRYYHDLTPTEIAQRLGAPIDTVETRVKRALARLRGDLRAGDPGPTWLDGLALLAGGAPPVSVPNQSAPAGWRPRWIMPNRSPKSLFLALYTPSQ